MASRITVADDGAGMTAEVRDHAFEPFFTTKEAGEGTGLGLATVHGVVIDAGGTSRSTRRSGRARRSTIFLPQSDEALTVPEEPVRARARAADGASVLVVEDQDPVRRQACRILEAHGYSVRDAPSADEALADWQPVDVLVTDVVMPGMSGQQLAEIARERIPGLRVVFMSGHTDDVLVRDGARHGDIAFVQKPFTRNSLLRAVEEALAQRERARAAVLTARRSALKTNGGPEPSGRHLLHRSSKMLEPGAFARHHSLQRRVLSSFDWNPAVLWRTDPPAPRDRASGAGAPQRRRLAHLRSQCRARGRP